MFIIQKGLCDSLCQKLQFQKQIDLRRLETEPMIRVIMLKFIKSFHLNIVKVESKIVQAVFLESFLVVLLISCPIEN